MYVKMGTEMLNMAPTSVPRGGKSDCCALNQYIPNTQTQSVHWKFYNSGVFQLFSAKPFFSFNIGG